MAWTRLRTTVLVSGTVLVAVTTATLVVNQAHRDPTRPRVLEIIRTNMSPGYPPSAPGAIPLIAKLGPRSLPALEGLVRQKETAFDRTYEEVRTRLPDWIKQQVPDRSLRKRMHYLAVNIVYELGPAAARPLSAALCS